MGNERFARVVGVFANIAILLALIVIAIGAWQTRIAVAGVSVVSIPGIGPTATAEATATPQATATPTKPPLVVHVEQTVDDTGNNWGQMVIHTIIVDYVAGTTTMDVTFVNQQNNPRTMSFDTCILESQQAIKYTCAGTATDANNIPTGGRENVIAVFNFVMAQGQPYTFHSSISEDPMNDAVFTL